MFLEDSELLRVDDVELSIVHSLLVEDLIDLLSCDVWNLSIEDLQENSVFESLVNLSHELSQSRIKVVLDGIVRSPSQALSDVCPLVAILLVLFEQDLLLVLANRCLVD